jgi:RHS repeat-associated protein
MAGNMTSRTIAGQATQNLVWDESSRLETITQGTTTTGFLYDADGSRVARRDNGVTTVMIDNTFEWSSAGGLVKYYSHAGQVIAMRNATGLHWLFGDHLGSASTVRTPAGTNVRQRYLPFGRVRGAASLPTEYGFTGQRLDPSGLMDYNARQYDPILGRFTSPDTIIPDAADPQSFNRYAYVNNNPVNFTDPTGHCASPTTPSGSQARGWSVGGCPSSLALETSLADSQGPLSRAMAAATDFAKDPPYWDSVMGVANVVGTTANDAALVAGSYAVACAGLTGGFCALASPVVLPFLAKLNAVAGTAEFLVTLDSCVVNNVSGWGCAGHVFLVGVPFFQSGSARRLSQADGAWADTWWSGVSGTADRIDDRRNAGQATTGGSSSSSRPPRGGGGGRPSMVM